MKGEKTRAERTDEAEVHFAAVTERRYENRGVVTFFLHKYVRVQFNLNLNLCSKKCSFDYFYRATA